MYKGIILFKYHWQLNTLILLMSNCLSFMKGQNRGLGYVFIVNCFESFIGIGPIKNLDLTDEYSLFNKLWKFWFCNLVDNEQF